MSLNNLWIHAVCMFMLFSNVCAAEVTMYSHGYGESGPCDTHYSVEGFYNPDAKGPVYTKSNSFYTRSAVINLIDCLHEQVVQGNTSIHLVGRSCGAGVIINALAKLIEYDKNISYFKNSSITSKEQADAILHAINNGRLELVCPLLSLEKTVIVQKMSKGMSFWSWLLGRRCFKKVNDSCASLIHKTVIRAMFKDYDVNHISPIDALPLLAGKITCSTVIQVCKNDGVVDNAPEDVALLYRTLRTGNESKTHIFVSTDAWHNSISTSYLKFKKQIDTCIPVSEQELLDTLKA